MGACKTLKKILIDKQMTMAGLAEATNRPRQTLYNTFQNDKLRVETAMEYGKALGCSLCYIDDESGEIYKID